MVLHAGGKPEQASKRQAQRRLQQRAALRNLNRQPASHAGPLYSAVNPSPSCFGQSDSSTGQPEPSAHTQSPADLTVGRQPGLPGRPAFEGGTLALPLSSSLLQPGHQGRALLPQTGVCHPKHHMVVLVTASGLRLLQVGCPMKQSALPAGGGSSILKALLPWGFL